MDISVQSGLLDTPAMTIFALLDTFATELVIGLNLVLREPMVTNLDSERPPNANHVNQDENALKAQLHLDNPVHRVGIVQSIQIITAWGRVIFYFQP